MSDPFGPYGLPGHRDQLPPFLPGGYPTLVSGTPVITSDQASKTIVYYTQDAHNAFPIIKNGTRHAVYFDEPQLALSSAHAANTIYDVFGVERNGKGHLVTGPAWANSAAGAGDRGAGGGTSEHARAGGALVNRWGIPGLNGNGSQFINPGEGCYLFSIFVDSVAGQLTCHRSYGQSRKWGIWSPHNRRPLYLKAGDATASWAYTSATKRASRGDSTNSLIVFCGLADEIIDAIFAQHFQITSSTGAATTGAVAIGWNSTTVVSGRAGTFATAVSGTSHNADSTPAAAHTNVPALGINTINALEYANATFATTYFGGEDDMILKAMWRG